MIAALVNPCPKESFKLPTADILVMQCLQYAYIIYQQVSHASEELRWNIEQ
jgi:hypothetical protein